MLAIDARLFHLVNAVWTNRLFDVVMPVVTDLQKVRVVSFVLAPAAMALWLYLERRRGVAILLGLVLTVGLADSTSHRLIKPYFHRDRPQKAGLEVVLRTPAHYGYSFPSNHATNCFAGAVFLGSAYPAALVPLLAAASVVAYSRVYVGVHFPFDVIGGALFGSCVGWLVALAFKRKGLLASRPDCRAGSPAP